MCSQLKTPNQWVGEAPSSKVWRSWRGNGVNWNQEIYGHRRGLPKGSCILIGTQKLPKPWSRQEEGNGKKYLFFSSHLISFWYLPLFKPMKKPQSLEDSLAGGSRAENRGKGIREIGNTQHTCRSTIHTISVMCLVQIQVTLSPEGTGFWLRWCSLLNYI